MNIDGSIFASHAVRVPGRGGGDGRCWRWGPRRPHRAWRGLWMTTMGERATDDAGVSLCACHTAIAI